MSDVRAGEEQDVQLRKLGVRRHGRKSALKFLKCLPKGLDATALPGGVCHGRTPRAKTRDRGTLSGAQVEDAGCARGGHAVGVAGSSHGSVRAFPHISRRFLPPHRVLPVPIVRLRVPQLHRCSTVMVLVVPMVVVLLDLYPPFFLLPFATLALPAPLWLRLREVLPLDRSPCFPMSLYARTFVVLQL